jgi:hypothetical protein
MIQLMIWQLTGHFENIGVRDACLACVHVPNVSSAALTTDVLIAFLLLVLCKAAGGGMLLSSPEVRFVRLSCGAGWCCQGN